MIFWEVNIENLEVAYTISTLSMVKGILTGTYCYLIHENFQRLINFDVHSTINCYFPARLHSVLPLCIPLPVIFQFFCRMMLKLMKITQKEI